MGSIFIASLERSNAFYLGFRAPVNHPPAEKSSRLYGIEPPVDLPATPILRRAPLEGGRRFQDSLPA
jgi:hypothetical protein